jgi:hypothetical protein
MKKWKRKVRLKKKIAFGEIRYIEGLLCFGFLSALVDRIDGNYACESRY